MTTGVPLPPKPEKTPAIQPPPKARQRIDPGLAILGFVAIVWTLQLGGTWDAMKECSRVVSRLMHTLAISWKGLKYLLPWN